MADDLAVWIAEYRAILGYTWDAHNETFAAWLREFQVRGYTAEELRAATGPLTESPPQRLADQLAEIHRAVRELRRRRRDAEARERRRLTAAEIEQGWAVWHAYREGRR